MTDRVATGSSGSASLLDLPVGSHVCWVVPDDAPYDATAAAILMDGRDRGEKAFAFGPEGSGALAALASSGTVIADPHSHFLAGGRLHPERMFTMFREQMVAARAEGHRGLRLVADMDWLKPTGASATEVVEFETMLDRLVLELGATIVCAYRAASYDQDALGGVAAVHPKVVGAERMFELVAAGPAAWRLSGEVDLSTRDSFAAAFASATADGPVTIDVGGLTFIDCAGMRAIANAIARAPSPVRFRAVPSSLRRFWALARLDEVAPIAEI